MFRLAVSLCAVLVLSHTLNLVWCAPRDYASDIGAVSAKYPSVSGVGYAENVGLNYISALPQINYENKKALQQLRQIQQQQQKQYEEENSKVTLNGNNNNDNNKKLEEEEKSPSHSNGQQHNVKYYVKIYVLENKKDGKQQNSDNGGDNQKQLTPAKIHDSKELQDWLKYFNSLPFISNVDNKQKHQENSQEQQQPQAKLQQVHQHHQIQRPQLQKQQEKHTQIQQQEQDEYVVPDVKVDDKKERQQPKKQQKTPTNRQIDYYKYLQQLALYQASAGEIVYNKKSQQTTTAVPKVEDTDSDYDKIIIQQHKQKQTQHQENKKVEAKKEAVLINANDFYNLYNQQLKNVLADSKLQNAEDQYYIVGGYDQQKRTASPYVNVLTVEPRAGANKYNLDGSAKEQIVLLRPNNSGGGAAMVILHDGSATSLGLKH